MSSTSTSPSLTCRSCGTILPSGGTFCPRCGARYGATPMPHEDFTDGLVAVVKAIIGIAGAFLVAYGGWAGAVAVYQVIPYDTRPFVQAITGIVGRNLPDNSRLQPNRSNRRKKTARIQSRNPDRPPLEDTLIIFRTIRGPVIREDPMS